MGDSPDHAAGNAPDRAPDHAADHAADHARRRLESEFLLALRRSGAVMQLLGAASAERIGINVTDLNCLNILALRGQMTAGELAKATGLTTASITGVLDRLEEAGFVRRERDTHDRRRVVVHLDATRGLRDVAPVFAPVVEAWRAVATQYTDEQLTLILGFQAQLEQIMRDRLIELRGGTPAA
jgi:DNA-binding MarR family transcriptional regulator